MEGPHVAEGQRDVAPLAALEDRVVEGRQALATVVRHTEDLQREGLAPARLWHHHPVHDLFRVGEGEDQFRGKTHRAPRLRVGVSEGILGRVVRVRVLLHGGSHAVRQRQGRRVGRLGLHREVNGGIGRATQSHRQAVGSLLQGRGQKHHACGARRGTQRLHALLRAVQKHRRVALARQLQQHIREGRHALHPKTPAEIRRAVAVEGTPVSSHALPPVFGFEGEIGPVLGGRADEEGECGVEGDRRRVREGEGVEVGRLGLGEESENGGPLLLQHQCGGIGGLFVVVLDAEGIGGNAEGLLRVVAQRRLHVGQRVGGVAVEHAGLHSAVVLGALAVVHREGGFV